MITVDEARNRKIKHSDAVNKIVEMCIERIDQNISDDSIYLDETSVKLVISGFPYKARKDAYNKICRKIERSGYNLRTGFLFNFGKKAKYFFKISW